MSIEMLRCPHCDTQVIPMADGICPACRMNTQHSRTSEPSGVGEVQDAWDKFNESLQPGPVDSFVKRLDKIERPYRKSCADAVTRLRHYATGDPQAADRIRQELLPRYFLVIEQLKNVGAQDPAASLVDLAELRVESWRILADALSENDVGKLELYDDLWGRSEMLLVSLRGGADSPESPTKSVKEFQRGLSAFTPRLIATPAIVLVNIVVFATMIASGANILNPTVQTALEWGANFGPATTNGQWWRLVTCMFLHFGIIHLGFNMWVLWDLGQLVERLVGNAGFVILYFVSGISGSLASLSWNPLVVSGGASGAVFGVVGALLGLIALRRDTIPLPVLKHLSKSMLAFVGYNLIFGALAPGIDMAAHIGGLIAGMACGLILSQPLSREMVNRRKVRNAIVAIAGGAVSVLWILNMPDTISKTSPPTCTDPEVVRLLDQIIRDATPSTKLKSIGSHREISYDSDAGVRQGECIAYTDDGPEKLRFVVEWQDSSKRLFQIRILPPLLPECTDTKIVKLLKPVFETTHPDVELERLYGHREVRYDSEDDVRYGECVAITQDGEFPVRYLVEWQDQNDGSYQVRIPPDDLPSCTDPEVMDLLDRVIRGSLVDINLHLIDGHREVTYDNANDIRYGECVIHTDAGQFGIPFVVKWENRPRGMFLVQLIDLQQ